MEIVNTLMESNKELTQLLMKSEKENEQLKQENKKLKRNLKVAQRYMDFIINCIEEFGVDNSDFRIRRLEKTFGYHLGFVNSNKTRYIGINVPFCEMSEEMSKYEI